MPVYTCVVRPDDLAGEQKAMIAREITRIHCDVTGAPPVFVQVFFREIAPGDGFVGGEPFAKSTIVGLIRAGRSPAAKEKLLFGISEAWCAVTGQAAKNVFVAVVDLPAKNILEDGVLLPEPGEEQEWLAARGLADASA